MIKDFLKTTFRNMWKNKLYSFLNLLGLAIGIACAGFIFLWVENEVTYDNVHTKKDRLYAAYINTDQAAGVTTMASTPRIMAPALKTEIPGIVNTARVSYENQQLLFQVNDQALYAAGRYADSALFSMFTLPFKQGNAANAFTQLHSIVLTEKTANRFFGGTDNVIGETVRINHTQDYIVTGILKDIPENSTLQFEWLIPFENDPYYSESLSWDSYGPLTYVELDAHADRTAIDKQLTDFIRRKDASQQNGVFLFPMRDWHLYHEFEEGKPTGSGQIKQVNMLVVIGWIILLVACINFMNLTTANSQQRAKEVGVRKVLGIERKRLIGQFLGEAVMLASLAAILGLFLLAFALPELNSLIQKNLRLQLMAPMHLIALVTLVLVCGLLAGSYPAWYLSSFKPAAVLRGLKLNMRNGALRKGLVVFQFTVSIIFIISTIVVHQQIQYARHRDLGFNKDQLIEVDLQRNASSFFPLIKQELIQGGLVQNVALADHVILQGGNLDSRFLWEGKPANTDINIAFRDVSPEFMATAGMQLKAGRDFNATDGNSVIITQSLAKLMGDESPIGKIIQSPRGNPDGVYTNMTVVGVINDYVYGDVFGHSGPALFFNQQFDRSNLIYIRLNPTTDIAGFLQQMALLVKKYNPDYPLKYTFVDTQFNELFFMETLVNNASGIFAALAIIISCLGLFGLSIYTAEQRKKEIGVRKVLGAGINDVLRLITTDFIKYVLLALIIASPVAWWMMNQWLQDFAYRIEIQWWVFALSGITAILLALLTVSWQAVRAAVANPIESLRDE